MKSIFLLPLLLTILGCDSQTDKQTLSNKKETEVIHTETAKARAELLAEEVPALYTLEPATEEDFSKASAANTTVSFTMNKGDARKVNGIITLQINGKWTPIKDLRDTLLNTDDPDKKEYRYLGRNDELNKYLIAGSFYEGYETYLVDKTTGKISATTWAEPAVSPDKKYLANISIPTVMDPSPNGIQVWKVQNPAKLNVIEKHFDIEQQDWEPFEMYWESQKSIIIKVIPTEKYALLQAEPRKEDFSYLRLTIK